MVRFPMDVLTVKMWVTEARKELAEKIRGKAEITDLETKQAIADALRGLADEIKAKADEIASAK